MSLFAIRDYVKNAKLANLVTLSASFNSDPEIIKDKLNIWIRKGLVRKVNLQRPCKECTACGSCDPEIYEWVCS